MNPRSFTMKAVHFVLLLLMWAIVAPAAESRAAPPAQTVVTVELFATQDARIQAGSPDNGFGNGLIWVGTPDGHLGLVEFDVSMLPVNATIDSAELQLNFTGVYTPTANVELGRNDGPWDEATITWNTRPATTFGGPIQTIGDTAGVVSWNVTPTVARWVDGSLPNYGFALRGDGPLKSFHSKETRTGLLPKLVVVYSNVDEDDGQPRPDLGDAPDSTNHHGQPNTAYPVAGILGQFPTVYDVPANQPAGPRHDNQTGEGILGQFLSREREADRGDDQDGLNNILRDANGVVSDIADNDRGDDGWRNRNISFFDCRKQTLTVRISKAPNATLKKMYLNVWFDGNRDGDWDDIARCKNPNGGPDEASYEWLVQDRIIDMTAVPAGGFLDFDINTERVLNGAVRLPHWMRFTLSEERAVQPPNGSYPDGRGPHPNSAQSSFKYGETEDVFYQPAPVGEEGELILEKRVITQEDPVDYPGEVTYQIRLRHVGGSQPIEAQIRDQIGFPQHLLPNITQSGDVVYIEVSSPSGGASPLEAGLSYVDGDQPGIIEQLISWDGTLEPDSEVLLTFDVHVHPYCPALLNTKTITNIARARAGGGDPITAEASYEAKCPGYDADGGIQLEPHENPIDLDDLTHVPWQGTVWNRHPVSVTLGFFQEITTSDTPTPTLDVRPLGTVSLNPDEKRAVDFGLVVVDDDDDGDLDSQPNPTVGRLFFCIFTGEAQICPNADAYPNMEGDVPPPVWIPRPEELGDAPDSTNHFAGVAMTAYPGVQANFPTVFDPGTGADQGPKHRRPQLLHLGPNVSREAEADLGPDADGINNIWPPANANDQDWFDDGSQLSNLANCQPARVDVRVNVSQAAANWFDNKDRVAYLNVWLDSNHDGDWADGFLCVDEAGQNKEVVEHILIDYPIDVAALGTGLHSLNNIMTDRVGWPVQGAEDARWVRFTLSDEPANKTLTFGGIQYGDGRGYATAFRTGETEDYLKILTSQNNGPDLAVRLNGQIVERDTANQFGVRIKADYANVGEELATGGRLILNKSAALRNRPVSLVVGAGIQPGDLTDEPDRLIIALPDVDANQSRSLVIGFGPKTVPMTAASPVALQETFTATVGIALADDVNLNNNRATVTLETPNAPLRLAASVERDDLLRKADTTCRTETWFQGRGEPMALVDLYVNRDSNIQIQPDANGLIEDLRLTNLPEGRSLIWLNYANGAIVSPRDAASGQAVALVVDPSLPVDPITLLLTDSQGRQFHPSTLGWSRYGAQMDQWPLQEGEVYTIRIQSCASDPNLTARLWLNEQLLSTLFDEEGNGLYSGSFTYQTPVLAAGATLSTANQLRFVVEAGGTEQRFDAEVAVAGQGIVVDAATNQPLADATVTALVVDSTGLIAITAIESNQPEAQSTGADGAYAFNVADGTYQLAIVRDGYQPYRTGDIEVTNGELAVDTKLSPAIAEPATHVINITSNGFVPATVTAQPGDVVMWVNSDLVDHATVQATLWDSGQLATGETYKVKVTIEGEFSYQDGENGSQMGLLIVQNEPTSTPIDEPGPNPDPTGESTDEVLYLPLVSQ